MTEQNIIQVIKSNKHKFKYVGYCETGYLHETYKSLAEERNKTLDGDSRNTRENYQYLTTTHGVEFQDILFIGVGVGMHYYTKFNRVTFPIFADLRLNCLKEPMLWAAVSVLNFRFFGFGTVEYYFRAENIRIIFADETGENILRVKSSEFG